jgi:opacity protein-like surface antigen
MRTILACSAIALLLGQPAMAQDSETTQAAIDANAIAVASATSYTPIHHGTALDVSSAANTELASDAVELVSGTLKQHGYNVSYDAPYALDVTAVLVRGVGQDRGVQSPYQGSVRGDEYTNADQAPSNDPLTRGNLFDNSNGAILTPAQPQQGGHLLRVSLSVYDRKSGLYIWRGQIERDSVNVDVDSSMQQMVPALLAHFGQSLPQTEVPLR